MNRTSIPKNGLRQTMARAKAQNRRTRRFQSLQQALANAGLTPTGRTITIRMSDFHQLPSKPSNLAQEPVEAEKAPVPAQNPPEAVSDALSELERQDQAQDVPQAALDADILAERQAKARERAKRDRYNAARKLKRQNSK